MLRTILSALLLLAFGISVRAAVSSADVALSISIASLPELGTPPLILAGLGLMLTIMHRHSSR